MEKLKFKFSLLGKPDGKSNVVSVMSIETTDGRVFDMPDEFKAISKHTYIANSNMFAKIKNSLKKRHQTRNLWIPVDIEIRKVYLDECENIQFEEQYLEEIKQTETQNSEDARTPSVPPNVVPKTLNIGKIADKFLLEKFSIKTPNASQWILEFEKECDRFELMEDKRKIEMLKHLLEKQCLDWYMSMLIKLTINSSWEVWQKNFCETYGKKGWSQIKYAYSFKFQAGSLIEYATKKERILLEVNRSIDDDTMINLIVLGLPEKIIDKLDKESLKSTIELFSEINKYDHLVYKKNEKATVEAKGKFESKLNNSKKMESCTICEKLNKGVRFHSEKHCWFKTKVNKGDKESEIRLVNNSELEYQIKEEDPKNS